jgi:hypothetical protein
MNYGALLILPIVVGIMVESLALDVAKYHEFNAEDSFKSLLDAMPVQMETGGAKLFKLPDGSLWLVSIGTTSANPTTPAELLRRRTVAKVKAQANAVAELHGTQVKAKTILTNKSRIVIRKDTESGIVEEVLDETIVTEARGALQSMPIIATWMDKSEQMFFLAIGKRIK